MTSPLQTRPDLYTNVHKGIRRALFATCDALGRASGDASREASARRQLHDALRFVAQHGENEDVVLLPALREKAPSIVESIQREHHALDEMRMGLESVGSVEELYLATCAFAAKYLAHLDEEERIFEPQIRAVLSVEEIASFGRKSVERTAPADQRMMLGWMLPAMPVAAAHEILGRLPPAVADELRRTLE